MKILHVTQGYHPAIGGTEWLVQRVSEELVRQFGDEVTVFTTNCYNGEGFFTPSSPRMPVGWDEIKGVKVRRFPVSSRISQFLRFPQSVAYNLGLPGNQYLRAWASGPIIPELKKKSKNTLLTLSWLLLSHFCTCFPRSRQPEQSTALVCFMAGYIHWTHGDFKGR